MVTSTRRVGRVPPLPVEGKDGILWSLDLIESFVQDLSPHRAWSDAQR